MIWCCKVENCVGKGLVVLGYGAAMWGNHILIFWESILPSSAVVSRLLLNLEGEWKLVKVYSF